eukprot:5982011-Pyramimonas_sp.AAC.1
MAHYGLVHRDPLWPHLDGVDAVVQALVVADAVVGAGSDVFGRSEQFDGAFAARVHLDHNLRMVTQGKMCA